MDQWGKSLLLNSLSAVPRDGSVGRHGQPIHRRSSWNCLHQHCIKLRSETERKRIKLSLLHNNLFFMFTNAFLFTSFMPSGHMWVSAPLKLKIRGLYQKRCGQQRNYCLPVLSTYKAVAQILCPVFSPTLQGRHWGAGTCPGRAMELV